MANTGRHPDLANLSVDPRDGLVHGMVPPRVVGNPFAPKEEGGSGMGDFSLKTMNKTRGTERDGQTMNTEYVRPTAPNAPPTSYGNGVYGSANRYGIHNPAKEALPGHSERFWPAVPYVGVTALLNTILPNKVLKKIFSDERYTGDSKRRREDADTINR
jgi:hypothetical protein